MLVLGIAGRLAREYGRTLISHESIYRFIYHRSARKDYWHRLLPRAKSRRGKLAKRGGGPGDRIANRVSIHQRPKAAENRLQPGHREADLMLFGRYGQAVLVVHERSSRFTKLWRQPNKKAKPVAGRLTNLFAQLPPRMRRSVTFDNGIEFAFHHLLDTRIGMEICFCDTHAPWQKGGIENAIARLRRQLPGKSDLAAMIPQQLHDLVARYNQTPRKCLDFKTPWKPLAKSVTVWHFKRESTPRRAPV